MVIESKTVGGITVVIKDEGTTFGRGRYVLYVNGSVKTSSDNLSDIMYEYIQYWLKRPGWWQNHQGLFYVCRKYFYGKMSYFYRKKS